MISVEKAKEIINRVVEPLGVESINVGVSLNRVLAEDLVASLNLPPFNQSAMDGYAIRFEDYKDGCRSFQLVGEVKAGDEYTISPQAKDCVRIFTGAKVPDGYDIVVMQEQVQADGTDIKIQKDGLSHFVNIRLKGEQITHGDIALKKGTILTSAHIGYLNALGFANIKAYQLPKVALLVTGNELVQAGEEIKEGEIYESNANMLKSAFQTLGVELSVEFVKDDYESTKQQLDLFTNEYDLVLASGGISVGDYDYVGKALYDLGVKEHFYKIKQKPGKPIFFGGLNGAYVFGLPGNPASALVGFYEYVYPCFYALQGTSKKLTSLTLQSATDIKKKEGRAGFLKAQLEGGEVNVLGGQGSHILASFAEANALIYLSENQSFVNKGDHVEVHLLPH